MNNNTLLGIAIGLGVLNLFQSRFFHIKTKKRLMATEQNFRNLADQTKQSIQEGRTERAALQASNEELRAQKADLETRLQAAIDADGGMSKETEETIYALLQEAIALPVVQEDEEPTEDEGTDKTEA